MFVEKLLDQRQLNSFHEEMEKGEVIPHLKAHRYSVLKTFVYTKHYDTPRVTHILLRKRTMAMIKIVYLSKKFLIGLTRIFLNIAPGLIK